MGCCEEGDGHLLPNVFCHTHHAKSVGKMSSLLGEKLAWEPSDVNKVRLRDSSFFSLVNQEIKVTENVHSQRYLRTRIVILLLFFSSLFRVFLDENFSLLIEEAFLKLDAWDLAPLNESLDK